MNLDQLKASQMAELMSWADTLENILTPDKLTPDKIQEYPLAMETSERLKRICQWKGRILKEQSQELADMEMDAIEQELMVTGITKEGHSIMKKKYSSAERRNRELRLRLANNKTYQKLKTEQEQWDIMASDWISHHNRLRRELNILSVNYTMSGGTEF